MTSHHAILWPSTKQFHGNHLSSLPFHFVCADQSRDIAVCVPDRNETHFILLLFQQLAASETSWFKINFTNWTYPRILILDGHHDYCLADFCLGTGVPRHRDGVVRPYVRTYVRTYVFSELCSIFQYVIKRWLRALQLKAVTIAYEYTYQDNDYPLRTMNTKHERCGMAFLLQAAHKIAVSC